MIVWIPIAVNEKPLLRGKIVIPEYSAAVMDSWLDVDPKIRAVIEHVPIQALTHVLIAPMALLLGPFQFFPGLRAKYPQAHRWSGRVYVAACVVAGYWGAGNIALCVRRPGRGTRLRHSGGAVARYDAWRLARRCAAPIRAPSAADALQLRDDLRRGDLAFANPDRARAGIPELFGDVRMARLHLMDAERDRRGALFDDSSIAPSGGACDLLISDAGNTKCGL